MANLMTRLFRRRHEPARPANPATMQLPTNLDVVGESRRRTEIMTAVDAAGGYHSESSWAYTETTFTLTREPGNKHDPNTVAVLSEGGPVGYLDRNTAAVVAAGMDTAGVGRIEDVPGRIMWKRRDNHGRILPRAEWRFGVRLEQRKAST